MAGLLDMVNDPRQAFLTNLGMGLLSAGGPSARPMSFGQAVGAAMPGALQGAQQAQTYQAQVEEARRKQEAEQRRMQAVGMMPPEAQQAVMAGVPIGDVWKQMNPEAKFESYFDPTSGQERKGFIKPGAAPMPVGGAKAESMEYDKVLRAAGILPGTPQYTQMMRQYATKQASHPQPVSVSYGAPVAALDAQGNPVFIQPSKSGGAASVIPGVRPPEVGKPPTEAESKAAFYAQNMRAASQVLNELEASGVDMSRLGTQAETALAGGLGNLAAGSTAQQVRQAQNQWAEQMLRMQTGAAATKDEIDRTVSTYFPRPGDEKAVVDQKRTMRKQAEEGVVSAAGRAGERIKTPGNGNLPKSRFFDVDGKKIAAKLESDGNYYVTQNGKRYRVEE